MKLLLKTVQCGSFPVGHSRFWAIYKNPHTKESIPAEEYPVSLIQEACLSGIMASQKYQFHLIPFTQTEYMMVFTSHNLIFSVRDNVLSVKFQPDIVSLLIKQKIPDIRPHLFLQKGNRIFMAVNCIKLVISICMVPVSMGIHYSQRHPSGYPIHKPLQIPDSKTGVYQHSLLGPCYHIAPWRTASICIFRVDTIHVFPETVDFRIRVYLVICHLRAVVKPELLHIGSTQFFQRLPLYYFRLHKLKSLLSNMLTDVPALSSVPLPSKGRLRNVLPPLLLTLEL